MGESQYDVSGLAKAKTNLQKKPLRSSQAQTERVQKLSSEYWQQVQQVEPENLVFLDEMGVLLGLTRTHARSPQGTRMYDFKNLSVSRDRVEKFFKKAFKAFESTGLVP